MIRWLQWLFLAHGLCQVAPENNLGAKARLKRQTGIRNSSWDSNDSEYLESMTEDDFASGTPNTHHHPYYTSAILSNWALPSPSISLPPGPKLQGSERDHLVVTSEAAKSHLPVVMPAISSRHARDDTESDEQLNMLDDSDQDDMFIYRAIGILLIVMLAMAILAIATILTVTCWIGWDIYDNHNDFDDAQIAPVGLTGPTGPTDPAHADQYYHVHQHTHRTFQSSPPPAYSNLRHKGVVAKLFTSTGDKTSGNSRKRPATSLGVNHDAHFSTQSLYPVPIR